MLPLSCEKRGRSDTVNGQWSSLRQGYGRQAMVNGQQRPGSLLVDALLAITIFGLVVAAFSSGIGGGREGTVRGGSRARAIYLAEEGLEAVRTIRDKANGFAANIATKTPGANYYVKLSGTDWMIDASAPQPIDGVFTRRMVFSHTTPSNANARKVTSTVEWTEMPGNQTRTISLETHLSNWRTNPPPPPPNWVLSCVEGRYAAPGPRDFTDVFVEGDFAYVSDNAVDGFYIFNISDPNAPALVRGENINDGLGYRDVAKKDNIAYIAHGAGATDLVLIDVDTPGGITARDLTGDNGARGIVRSANKLYVVRSNDAAGDEYVELDITTAATPSELAGRGVNMDDRASNAIALNGNFAYLGTNFLARDLTVIDGSASPVQSGGTDVGTGTQGTAVAVHNNVAYLGTSANYPYELYAIDISGTPGMPPAPPGSPPGSMGAGYNTDSGTSGEVRDIAVSAVSSALFLATNAESGGGNRNFYQAVDISVPLDIQGSEKRLDTLDMTAGCPGAGHMCNAGDGAKGIAYRPAGGSIPVDTVYLVGERYLLVIRPGGCT